MLGAKTIAATFLDLLTEPALLQQAHDEFDERTGGGVGGTKWVPPLLPKDFQPPVDLRWPEYIQTARGEEVDPDPVGRIGRRRAALSGSRRRSAFYLFRDQYPAAAGNTVWQRVASAGPSSASAAARQTA